MTAATALALPPPTESRYMPLHLKRILYDHELPHAQWCNAVRQTGPKAAGRPLSTAAGTQLLNRDRWPQQTPREEIIRQTAEWLRGHGVSEEDIAIAFDWDPEDSARGKQASRLSASPEKRQARASQRTDTSPFETDLPETAMLTPAAKQHFKLSRDPFTDDVQKSDDVFLSSEHRYIREAMFQTARIGGFLAVIGESGAGKTTLRRDLIERIQREQLPIITIQPRTIDKSRLTAGAICDAIISDVSATEVPKLRLEAKARQIERLLTGSSRSGNSHALIIEEAHDLSVQTLKYLKRFWELEDGFRKLLSIILVGQPELKAKLDERQNWEAREVIRRCEIAELQPLNGDLEDYLELKFTRARHMHAVGDRALDSIFEAGACDAIRDRLTLKRRGSDSTVSMHYPLVVNNLVTRCLCLAQEIGAERVTADIVREA